MCSFGMSTLKERLLSDSSATDGMGNQMNDVDKQLAIKNPFAQEQEEDQKGDSIGLDVSQEKTEVDPVPVKEANGHKEGIDDLGKIDITSQVKVCACSDMPQPGGTALRQVLGHSTMKKPEEDTTQNEEANKDVVDIGVFSTSVDPPSKQKPLKEEEEEAGITEVQQETLESPPTNEEEANSIPSKPKITSADVKNALKENGGNVLHLFLHHMEKDAELPEGEYACNGSCPCNCGGSQGKCVIGYQFNKIKVASLKEGPTTAAIQWDGKKHPNITLIVKALMLLFYSITLVSNLPTYLSKIHESTPESQLLFDVLSTFLSFVGTMVSFIALLVFFGRRCGDTIQCWDRLLGCVKTLCTTTRIRLTCCCEDCICCGKSTITNEHTTDTMEDRMKTNEHMTDTLEDRMKTNERKTDTLEDRMKTNERKTDTLEDRMKTNEHMTDTLEDRMKGSRCYGCCSTQLQRLNRGKWATIAGNFSEMFLTVLDEIISTVIIVLSLYTLIGRQQYRVFYIVTEWTEVWDIIRIIASFLIFLASHIKRVSFIAKNIYDFDKDIAKLPEEKLKRNFCQRLFGFQGRLVVHAFLLSLLQVYCILALAWKIIRDHCISEEEVETITEIIVINGTVFTSTLPTAFEFGSLRGCSVPSLQPATVNNYTIYNIIYVSVLLPILSYLILFVSNIPFFVEYCQLLHASGIYKFETAIDESKMEEVEKGVTTHYLLEIFVIFFKVLNPNYNFNEEELKRKKDELAQERDNVEKDIIDGPYNDMQKKIGAVMTFFPIVIPGFVHLFLFFLHFLFLSCRYSPQFGVACFSTLDNFSVFTQSLTNDKIVVYVPLILLFFLIGFPGPFVAMMWIGIISTTIMVLVTIGPFIVVLLVVGRIQGNSNN